MTADDINTGWSAIIETFEMYVLMPKIYTISHTSLTYIELVITFVRTSGQPGCLSVPSRKPSCVVY